MVDTVEPVVGRTADSSQHRQLVVDAMDELNWVPAGFTTTDGGGLTANVAAGRAFLAGALAERDVLTALTMAGNSTNRIFVYIDDVLDDGVVYFHVDQDDTPPTQGPSHKIATVTTSAVAITLITDERRVTPELSGGLRLNGDLDLLSGNVLLAALATVDGVDVSVHTHDGAGQGGTVPHSAVGGVSPDQHHAQAHIASSTGPHAESGLTAGHVLRASAAAAFAFAQLQHADLGGVTSDLHHPQLHAAQHEPGGGDAMAVDAAAATGSLRTIGGGALQAAAGDHAHQLVEVISLWAESMKSFQGSPVEVNVGFQRAWDFPPTGTTRISGAFRIPASWAGATIAVDMMLGGVPVGTSVMEVRLRALATNEDFSTGGQLTTLTVNHSLGTGLKLRIVNAGNFTAFAAGEWVMFNLSRLGDDAADDNTGQQRVFGITFR